MFYGKLGDQPLVFLRERVDNDDEGADLLLARIFERRR
jgi:hypothetical protein